MRRQAQEVSREQTAVTLDETRPAPQHRLRLRAVVQPPPTNVRSRTHAHRTSQRPVVLHEPCRCVCDRIPFKRLYRYPPRRAFGWVHLRAWEKADVAVLRFGRAAERDGDREVGEGADARKIGPVQRGALAPDPLVSGVARWGPAVVSAEACKKTVSFCEFSLCLPRACLGKIIILMYKWLKKTVFSYRACQTRRRPIATRKLNTPLFF
jgi:hypothetical protein